MACAPQLVPARRMLRSCATTRGWWAQHWTAASSHASGEGLQAATGDTPSSSSRSSNRRRTSSSSRGPSTAIEATRQQQQEVAAGTCCASWRPQGTHAVISPGLCCRGACYSHGSVMPPGGAVARRSALHHPVALVGHLLSMLASTRCHNRCVVLLLLLQTGTRRSSCLASVPRRCSWCRRPLHTTTGQTQPWQLPARRMWTSTARM